MPVQYPQVIHLVEKPTNAPSDVPKGEWFLIQYRPNEEQSLLLLVVDLPPRVWIPLSARIRAFSGNLDGVECASTCTPDDLNSWEIMMAPYFPSYIVEAGGYQVVLWTLPGPSTRWYAAYKSHTASGATPGDALLALLLSRTVPSVQVTSH